MDPFDRMYGKACLQVQIVLHVDSSSGLKTKLTFQFPGLCLRSSAGRTDAKLIGVFAQEKHCTRPWPNPQHHKWKNHVPWLNTKAETCEWKGTSAFIGKLEVYVVNSESSNLLGTQCYVL